MDKTYLRGDMYYADLGQGIGSEQEGYRPVVIVQNDIGNKYSPTVVVASITSKIDVKAKLPTHYFIGTENGLQLPSIVLLEQLRTIDKRRLEGYIGRLSKNDINGLNHALAISVDLIHKINDAFLMSLCSACEQHFRKKGFYYLYRLDPDQTEKDICSYCNKRRGYNWMIVKKTKRRW